MVKKVHWTQTPEGKEKLSKAMRKGWKQRKKRVRAAKRKTSRKVDNSIRSTKSAIREANNNIHRHDTKEEIKKIETVAFTHCEAWLSVYADSYGISRAYLAERVGHALLSYAERQKVGA